MTAPSMNPLLTTGLDPHRGTTALSVNLNKVALLRNTRTLGIPSVTRAATIALEAGAQGITVHPRPDERHIRAADVHELAALMTEVASDAQLRADLGERGRRRAAEFSWARSARSHIEAYTLAALGGHG